MFLSHGDGSHRRVFTLNSEECSHYTYPPEIITTQGSAITLPFKSGVQPAHELFSLTDSRTYCDMSACAVVNAEQGILTLQGLPQGDCAWYCDADPCVTLANYRQL